MAAEGKSKQVRWGLVTFGVVLLALAVWAQVSPDQAKTCFKPILTSKLTAVVLPSIAGVAAFLSALTRGPADELDRLWRSSGASIGLISSVLTYVSIATSGHWLLRATALDFFYDEHMYMNNTSAANMWFLLFAGGVLLHFSMTQSYRMLKDAVFFHARSEKPMLAPAGASRTEQERAS